MDREKLNIKIGELVDVLRTEEDRHITMSDIASITEVLITTMSRYFASIDTTIYREFQDLSDHIASMRADIARAQPKEIQSKRIPRAGKELDAVVQATEDATNTIMEAVETIMGADTTDVEAYALAVNDQCMRIFEACSFQDITGQRVTKVISTLTFIEERIGSILTAWPEGEDMLDEEPADPEAAAAPSDKELLNGPALEGEGISQDDVDSMFGGEGAPAEAEADPEPAEAEEAAPEAAPEPTPEAAPEPAKAEEAAPEPTPEPAKAEEAAPEAAPEPTPAPAPTPEPAKAAEEATPAEAAKPVIEDAGDTEKKVVEAVAEATAKPAPKPKPVAAPKANGADAKPAPAPAAKPKPAAAAKANGAAKPKPAAAAKGNGAAKPKPAAPKASAGDDDDDDGPQSSQDDIDALFD